MSKISHIKLQNFKCIDAFEADFRGCTAVVTGANDTGKSSFLRGIPERVRFNRPDVLVKAGEKDGQGEMILTTGERFIWEFNNDGKDKLTYITKEGLKQAVTVELGKRFFPTLFDIDKFLQSTPKKQSEQLQAIIGLDFTDIDYRYKVAYEDRTVKNREAELYHAKLTKMLKVDPIYPVDVTKLQERKEQIREKLNAQYQENRKHNEQLRKEWEREKDRVSKECNVWNDQQHNRKHVFDSCSGALKILQSFGYNGDAIAFVDKLAEEIHPFRITSEWYPPEPTYIDELPDATELKKVDADILSAVNHNAEAAKYTEYVEHKNRTEAARAEADKANELVLAIEAERQKMIQSANMPKGITITADGILIDGLPLDKNQISTSKLYCAALRIASMNLGDVKTLYFDDLLP